jgi:hypothetical protein
VFVGIHHRFNERLDGFIHRIKVVDKHALSFGNIGLTKGFYNRVINIAKTI